jgi:hypothetical protein
MASASNRLAVAWVAVAFMAASAFAAAPTIPTSLPYQGLLLDGLGAPRTGSVDLTVRIYDAVVGGTLVYKQSFPAVALADGVFTVQLGPSGEGSDAPSNPLTTSLATALAGDAGATAPVRFLEVTVGGDGALSRTQILSSAYAVRAASAATADTAATAVDATNVAGVSGQFVTEFFQEFNADGGGPPNFDPSEGVADADADGLLNFVDPDNDGDTLSDIAEVAQGSDINLVTPDVASLAPSQAWFAATTPVAVTGTGFQPGLTVAVGSQTPTPSGVTPTSFSVSVGPQTGGAKNVTVSLPNGQSDPSPATFTFATSLATPIDPLGFVALSLRPGPATMLVGGNPFTAFGPTAQLTSNLFSNAGGQIGLALDPLGRAVGARCRPGATCNVELLRDNDADGNLAEEVPLATLETLGGAATVLAMRLRYDGAGRPALFYLARDATTRATVAHDLTGDGDFADANERIALETLTNTAATRAELAIDAADRVAVAYHSAGASAVRVAVDRNGDGDFADTVSGNPELFSAVPGIATVECLGVTFDASGRLALVYGGTAGITLLRDLSADGDFADAGESQTVVSLFQSHHCDVAGRAGQALVVAASYADSDGDVTRILRLDRNDDGDFADAGESIDFSPGLHADEVELDGTNQAVVAVREGLPTGVRLDAYTTN